MGLGSARKITLSRKSSFIYLFMREVGVVFNNNNSNSNNNNNNQICIAPV